MSEKKRFLLSRLAAAAVLAALLSVPALAADGAPYNVILSYTDEPSSSVTAVWRDDENSAAVFQAVPELSYAKSGFEGALCFPAECRDISLDGSGVWHYEADAVSLEPATSYVYRVGCDGSFSEPSTFTTADEKSDSLTFAYFGDVQTNADTASENALWGALAAAMAERNPDASFALMGGDIVESGISTALFDSFFENASPVFSKIPLLATNGNHESNFIGGKPELYLDYFAFPQNGPEGFEEEFYSFDAANCHILVLNSWIFSGEQPLSDADIARVDRWIAADLAASDADWQIVVTHVPVYSVASDTTAAAVREHWEPIFDKYGVDLVFEGHQHVYSRSYPMYGGMIDYENGVTYIMGNSGQKFYSSADETFAERTIYGTATYQLVQIAGDTLTVQTCDIDGNELDFVSIMQRECEASFTDTASDAWYFRAASYAQAAGLFEGVGDGLFDPDGSMTRAMFATVLHRYAGLSPAEVAASFTDVPQSAWFAPHVDWAAENKLINGYGGGIFAPNDSVTLEQAVSILYRLSGGTASTEDALPDETGEISAWASEAMRWAGGTGLLKNVGGALTAQRAVTRAQIAALFLAVYGG